MTLTTRDKEIIKALNKFRVMDRNSIAKLFFPDAQNPERAANNVLLRLLRDGQIQRSKDFVPFVYFGPEVNIKNNSAKIPHFLKILDTYKEISNLAIQQDKVLETFQVEPKYGRKGDYAEPDIFCRYREANFFIEVQRTLYSEKQMNEKLERYVELYHSGVMGKPFPKLIILSEQRYAIDGEYPFKIFQAQTFTQLDNSLKPSEPAPMTIQSNLKMKTN